MDDRSLYIREVQNRLRELAFKDDRIPLISVDGIYGPQTAAAVRAFQEIYHLEPTGKVDKATWDTLYKVYLSVTNTDRPVSGIVTFPSEDYVVKIGDTGDLVYVIQLMLDAVHKVFDNVPDVEPTGVYDTRTSDSVKVIQKASRLPETGEVDKRTWDMLIGVYQTHRNFK